MAQEDVVGGGHLLSDAGLALGLSLGGGTAADGPAQHRRPSPPQCPLEPSLTLSMPDDAAGGAAGSGGGGAAHSVSSLSVGAVKRERAEEADGERVSSTAAGRDDADDDGSTRKKLRLTKEQSALLEDRFREHSTLNPKQKVALAKQLNLRPRQVEVWFQNRRARTKLKQTEVDCEFLKRCCETLTEENRRLQRELQELRAVKFAPPPPPPPSSTAHQPAAAAPFYMQLPAATLTICPSCERVGGPASAGKVADGAKAGPGRTTTHHFFNPFTHSAAC
ncbi:homeobox-leucine zipper protein HOX19-like isoform X2 [Oryza brachyantha]|uniref:homeobox-leucine zipper protein HOX19-like isoform X2 n=1 Tax=Oryza brachyantha TaxID=4533 RepID=UPI001ADBB0BE|nr:homeobox-leucine zipper protein HOX19-like isoform X2 [Oryza brachyantha]